MESNNLGKGTSSRQISIGEEVNLDIASKYFTDYNSKNNIVLKNQDDLEDSLKNNLVDLKKNNLISKYGYFYANYIKLERLFNSKINAENKIIKNISQIENKLKKFDNILLNKNTNINYIKNNISKEQEIIIKLLLLEVDKDLNKFEETITQLYSILQNFNIDNI